MSRFLRTLLVTVFVASLWIVVAATVSRPAQAAFSSCVTASPTVTQDNPGLLRFRATWTVAVPTSSSICATDGEVPQNAALPNELSGNPVKNLVCGRGITYIIGSIVCFQNWSIGVVDYYNISNSQTANAFSATQHINVGDSLIVTIAGLTGTSSHYTAAGAYIDSPAGSYVNTYPGYGQDLAGDERWCPPGGTPHCLGADPDLFGSGPFDAGNNLCWGVSLAEVQACARIGSRQTLSDAFSITADPGWTVTKNKDTYTLTATQPGTQHFQIIDSGHFVAEHRFYDLRFDSTPSFNAFTLTGASIANVAIVVDANAAPNNPPTTPVLSCQSPVSTYQNATVGFQASDPDAGDSIRYDIDSDYNGTTFNPTTYYPSSGYTSDYTQKTLPFQWASAGTKTVAVQVEDTHHATSSVATCAVVVTAGNSDTTPNLQMATDSGAAHYTDQTVYYDFPQDKWGQTATGITVPARYIGASAYASCVVTPLPQGARGSQPNGPSFATSWDSWPTFPSQPSYVSVPGGLHINGIAAVAPAVGTTYTFDFQYGCGSNAVTSQGSFFGSADTQTVIVRIVAGSTAPSVQLLVGQQGTTLQQYDQVASPYVFPTQLPSSGAAQATHVDLGWTANGVTNCVFTRNDTSGEQGTVSRSNWSWDGSKNTSSVFTGTDDTDMSFAAGEVLPTYTVIYAVNCTSATGPVSDVAYVKFSRTSFVGQPTKIQGTVFSDDGGTLGVQDAGELGQSNQQVKITIDNYPGGPSSTTVTTNGSGAYSYTFTPTLAQTQGQITIQLITPLANGWTYTAPLNGIYDHYLFNNGATYTYDFGIRNGQAAYSSASGKIYQDNDNNQAYDATKDVGRGGIQMELERITTYSSLPTTTENLKIVTSAADGSYTASTFVDVPPPGSTSVHYELHILALPGLGWKYSNPNNGVGSFMAVPNTNTPIDFGMTPPVTVTGTVFNDAGSGQPANQPPIAGISIQVFDISTNSAAPLYDLSTGSGVTVTSVTTSAQGTYSAALSPTVYGDTLQVRQTSRNASYQYCTTPAEGTAPAPDNNKYCEYAPELISTQYGKTITRNFGNSNSASSTVTVVTGRVYVDGDGVAGFTAGDTPLSNVVIGIYDQSDLSLPLATTLTDNTGLYSYSVAKNSTDYNNLLSRKIVIKQTAPGGYSFVSPPSGAYQPTNFDGNTLLGYDFIDETTGSIIVATPPNTGIFCDTD